MPRHDENSTDVQAKYNVPKEQIINDLRDADSLIVLSVKGGTATMWATDKPDKAQGFAAQYLGQNVVLPESAGFMAGASSDR